MLRQSTNMMRTVARSGTRTLATGAEGVNVAIAGVTGAVGQELCRILEERNFPIKNLKMLASARSAGKVLPFAGKDYTVEEMTEDSFEGVDIALFSAGGSQSKTYAPHAVKAGCVVVDNSSAYRMDPDVPLVVPEVNPEAVKDHKGIIANPNCSTIIMNVPVWPLHKEFGVKRAVVSTYQAASGAGAEAMRELEQQARDFADGKELEYPIFGRPYLFNCFSHNAPVDEDLLYNEEEVKMIKETGKIFGTGDDLKVSVTCVRVPVLRTHCEAINLEFEKDAPLDRVREILANSPGVSIVDDVPNNQFPEPRLASHQDDILVGRLREDLGAREAGRGVEMFIAGDQIRKGAATNAVQIAELLL